MRRSFLYSAVALIGLGAAIVPSCAQTSAPDFDGGYRFDASIDAGLPDQGVDGAVHDSGTGCDLGGNSDGGTTGLFATSTATDGTPYAATRTGGTWSALATSGSGYAALVATAYQGRPFSVGRKTDDSLVSAATSACTPQLGMLSPLFSMALTAERPAPSGGLVVDLVFRGSISGDQRLFYTRYDGSWLAAKPLGNFLSVLPPVALRSEALVHTFFTGTDGRVYDGIVDDNGGAASSLPMATSAHGPAAMVSPGNVTYVLWTGDDTNLYFSTHTMGAAYATPRALCDGQMSCLIASNQAPVVALDASGVVTAAWIGKDDGVIYSSTYDVGSSTWTPAVAASNEATSFLPALAPGLADASLEVVYVRSSDGRGRHTRKLGSTFSTAVDLPGSLLGSQPSLVRTP